MKMLMVWLIILGMLLAVAVLKVGLHFIYKNGAFTTKLIIGKLSFSMPKGKRLKTENTGSANAAKGKRKKKGIKSWFRAVIDNWYDILLLIGRVLSSPQLDVLRVKIDVGASEPDECALKYGRVCSIVGALLAPVENTFEVKKREVNIQCCFEEKATLIDAEAAITLRVYEIVVLAVSALKLGYGLFKQTKSNMKVV